MENEVYKKIVDEYINNKGKQEKYKKLLEKKELLEQDENVKEYLSIIKTINKYNKSSFIKDNEQLILNSFNNYSYQIKDTNNIYVYIGTYCYAVAINFKGTIDKSVDRDDPNADYRLYINLEKFMDSKKIPIDESEKFEKTHRIVYAKNRQEYIALQKQFIIDSVNYDQETAIQKILKK